MLEKLEGFDVTANDFLISVCGNFYEDANTEHDHKLTALLNRAHGMNFKNNKEKKSFYWTPIKKALDTRS